MEIRQNRDTGTQFGRETQLATARPTANMVALRWHDASKPLERRRTAVFTNGRRPGRTAIGTWSPSAGSRCRTAFATSRIVLRLARGRPLHGHGRTCRRRGIRPNRIKASLSVFQRCEVKVLGFDVKTRPRPQRMALRWCYVPFALVGANGKACGEAPRVLFSGTPPGVLGCAPRGVGVCFPCCCGLLTVFVCLLR